MPALAKSKLARSAVVGQMGFDPFIAALASGANIIVGGRAYDPACFAALPISQDFDPALSIHTAKVLECGAIACEPGSGADCIIAELHEPVASAPYALVYPSNPTRKATIKSVSAHTLYEKSHTHVFGLPGGILSTRKSEFVQETENTTKITGTEFFPTPLQIKLEGSYSSGKRVLSLLFVDPSHVKKIPMSHILFGRNGVCRYPTLPGCKEIGIVVKVVGENTIVGAVLGSIRSTLLHFGYPGRVSTAGNVSFPFSPSDFFVSRNSRTVGFTIAGSRDPLFINQLETVRASVINSVSHMLGADVVQKCDITFFVADEKNPLLVLETVAETSSLALAKHQAALKICQKWAAPPKMQVLGNELLRVRAGDACRYTLHHLIPAATLSKMGCFPIHIYEFDSEFFLRRTQTLPLPKDTINLGNSCTTHATAESLVSDTSDHIPEKSPKLLNAGARKLIDTASVIRSKNSGINELTFDILFRSEQSLLEAVESGSFSPRAVEERYQALFGNVTRRNRKLPRVLGCYFDKESRSIKITVERDGLAGDQGDRDVYGAQQHDWLLTMSY
eukprot:TRINITY_DN4209_c0_g1_i5.p1 TRINITY_DN4209_c0_g1~~TRINITY_DN4209_c0_g1_i5.p1  ORF type:complete len:562 (-),score=99.09 TRINITY_DN4209_c0_g1_i5:143-1828(-)